MADDRHYVPGDFYRIDDISGFKIRARVSRKQWDGLITTGHSWSPRHPQDFVQGVRDDQSVPDPRPRQTDQFVVTATYVTAAAALGAVTLSVANGVGFAGNPVQVMLDSGVPFYTIATGGGSTSITLANGLPSAMSGAFDNQIMVLPQGTDFLPWLRDDSGALILDDAGNPIAMV